MLEYRTLEQACSPAARGPGTGFEEPVARATRGDLVAEIVSQWGNCSPRGPVISRPRSFGWPLQLQGMFYNAGTQTDKSQAGGQHAKGEAGWEEERTGGGAVKSIRRGTPVFRLSENWTFSSWDARF